MNTNTINNKKRALVVIGVAALVLVCVVALVMGFISSNNTAAGDTKNKKATVSSAVTIKGEATTWVQTLVVKFKGMNKVPAKCANYVPEVDLNAVHLYVQEANKETPTAFGPEMGTKPCDVTIALVERMYRDPALLLADAKRLKLVKFEQKNRVKEINALKADADKRRELTNQVLGWYANTNHAFVVEEHSGSYKSDAMSSTGAVSAVSANKKSTVMTVVDRRTGKIKTQRRLDCGFQDFKPDKPRKPEKPEKPQCPPGSVMLPQGVCSEGKNANQAPVPTGGPVIHCPNGYLGRDGQCHTGTYTPPASGGGSGGSGGSDTGKGDSGPGATNTVAPPPTSAPAPAPPETSSPPTAVPTPNF